MLELNMLRVACVEFYGLCLQVCTAKERQAKASKT